MCSEQYNDMRKILNSKNVFSGSQEDIAVLYHNIIIMQAKYFYKTALQFCNCINSSIQNLLFSKWKPKQTDLAQ